MKKILIIIISTICVCATAWGQYSLMAYSFGKDTSGYEAHVTNDDGRIPDGTYWIFSLGANVAGGNKDRDTSSELCLDITNGSTENSALVQVYQRNFSAAQKFEVKCVDTVTVSNNNNVHHYFYTFKALHSGKYIDLDGGNMDNTTTVHQWEGTGGKSNVNQMWEVVALSDGGFHIRTRKVADQATYNKYNFGTWQPRIVPCASDKYSNVQGSKVKTSYYINEHSFAFAPVGSEISGLGGSNIYTIIPKSNENVCLQVQNASNENSALITFGTYLGHDHQKWTLEYINSGNYTGFYYLKAKHSGKYIHTKDGSKVGTADTNGNRTADEVIHQYEGTGGVNACWVLKDAGDGYYYIVNQSGQAMDAGNGSTITGHRMNSSDSQKFKLVRVYDGDDTSETIPEGLYRIHSPKTEADPELSLDVQQASKANSANVGIYNASESSKNQQWIISKDGAMDGFYTIKAHHSKLMLDVNGGKAVEGTNVAQYEKNSGVAQQWRFVIARDENGNPNVYRGHPVYYIFDYHGFALDDSGGKQESGDNVQIWQSNKTIAQKWALEPCFITKTISDAQYATMWYWDLDLQVPEGLEAFTMKLNADGTDVVRDKTYAAGARIPKNEAVVVHYLAEDIAAGQTKTFQFPVLQDLDEPDTTSPTADNCLKSTGNDQDITAESGKFIYRLTKGPKGVGFYMAAPANDQPAGKYLNNKAHLCYLQANFDAATKAVPNYVSLEAE